MKPDDGPIDVNKKDRFLGAENESDEDEEEQDNAHAVVVQQLGGTTTHKEAENGTRARIPSSISNIIRGIVLRWRSYNRVDGLGNL
mmetsp:Transcript_7449/g.16011  ORF Transcript_7449/g.16011 Transcript_7449/m.16011 type:complete len:86 (+) Transcript_7449:1585-1842(+)